MGKLWSYFIFLGWMSYLMTAGLFLFVGGFFLTRISRLERSNCTACNPLVDCDAMSFLRDPIPAAENCLEPRAKIVLLVVDALKYEFAEWQEGVKNPPYYLNKLPIIHQLLQKYPNHTRLYKSIVDPPSTTMQRLKAITTGTLPTFIDISSNFATGKIDEDNLVEQNAQRGVVFMGDDTWTGLYPGKFLRQFPSPSFNVWDLDTVDREVRNRIFFELQKTDWSLLIAHILGVDHCGHRHGPSHPEMARKLNETNILINEIVDSLGEDTMLFVMGDHGMTETGDHGGDSPNEVEAALFVYSKNPLQDSIKMEKPASISQIGIVPTIASILGTPIPFSNIGFVIVDLLPSLKKSKASDFWFTVHSVWKNVVQTKKYIDAYSADSFLFSEDKLEELDKHYNILMEEVKKVNDDETAKQFIQHAQEYSQLLRHFCVEIWVQFDAGLMFKGLILMFCMFFFNYLLITGVPESRMMTIFDSSFLRVSLSANFITLVTIYSLYSLQMIDEFVNTTFFATGAISLLFLVILVVQHWDVIAMTWYHNSKTKKINYLMRIILLCSICGLFSNSYVIAEDRVFSFLLITVICLSIYNISEVTPVENQDKRHRSPTKPVKYTTLLIILGFMVLLAIRLSSYFWRCRAEQMDECPASFLGKVGSITSSNLERTLLTVSLVGLSLYITVVRIWMRNCGNLSGFSPSVTVARYCPGLIVVCMGCYWILQRVPKDTKVKFVLAYQMNALPGVVYFFVIFAIVVLFFRPLAIFLLPRKRESLSVYEGEHLVPKLFDKVKELFYTNKVKEDDHMPIIYGLGTVYSAAFISLSVFLTLLYALLLGNTLASTAVLMIVTCSAVLVIVAMERFRNAQDIQELFQIPTSAVFSWFLIAEYFFYGSGHQATFPSIHWDAAFIGTGGHFYGNIIPAILIGINTFGSNLILGATLPLLVIAPFTIYVMFPKIAKVKFRIEDDMKRGELVLFDKESTFHYTLFITAIKYFLIHGLRTFGCMFAATIHCRHLMVWNIFAPKLIFEGLSFLVSLGSVLASIFFVLRIDSRVEELIARVTKTR